MRLRLSTLWRMAWMTCLAMVGVAPIAKDLVGDTSRSSVSRKCTTRKSEAAAKVAAVCSAHLHQYSNVTSSTYRVMRRYGQLTIILVTPRKRRIRSSVVAKPEPAVIPRLAKTRRE